MGVLYITISLKSFIFNVFVKINSKCSYKLKKWFSSKPPEHG